MISGEPDLDGKLPGHLNKDGIRIYSPADFAGMHAAGKLAAEILDRIAEHVVPGVSTLELDSIIHQMVIDDGARSATVGYKGYQHASCISINHVVCHGIPSRLKKLRPGDILNIDVTVIVDGWFGDENVGLDAGEMSGGFEDGVGEASDGGGGVGDGEADAGLGEVVEGAELLGVATGNDDAGGQFRNGDGFAEESLAAGGVDVGLIGGQVEVAAGDFELALEGAGAAELEMNGDAEFFFILLGDF